MVWQIMVWSIKEPRLFFVQVAMDGGHHTSREIARSAQTQECSQIAYLHLCSALERRNVGEIPRPLLWISSTEQMPMPYALRRARLTARVSATRISPHAPERKRWRDRHHRIQRSLCTFWIYRLWPRMPSAVLTARRRTEPVEP